MTKVLGIFILFMTISLTSYCQKWEQNYRPSTGQYESYHVIEMYDKGLMVTGVGSFQSLLYKTDINGNILWQRTIGDVNDSVLISAICATNDGGSAVTGSINTSDTTLDFFLLKLNACGEKEWCKIYEIKVDDCGFSTIKQLNDGGYIFNFYYYSKKNQCGVFRTDRMGNLIWTNFILTNPYSMIVDENENVIITGLAYLPNDTGPHDLVYIHGAVSKIDSVGRQSWFTSYNVEKQIYCQSMASQQTSDNGYLTVGVNRTNPKFALFLMKEDIGGNVLWTKLFGDTLIDEAPFDIKLISENKYIVTAYQFEHNTSNYHLKLVKINESGDVIKNMIYAPPDFYILPWSSFLTQDGHLFVVGDRYDLNGYLSMYLAKFNQNLQFDSFDTRAYTYDYLCTKGPAKTGTITIKGSDTVHADILHPLLYKRDTMQQLLVYPNPARDNIIIYASGFNNNIANCQIFDMIGRQVSRLQLQPLPDGIINLAINIQGYAKGMYVIELLQNGKRFWQKVVVQ